MLLQEILFLRKILHSGGAKSRCKRIYFEGKKLDLVIALVIFRVYGISL
jgi:hypothetical protein